MGVCLGIHHGLKELIDENFQKLVYFVLIFA